MSDLTVTFPYMYRKNFEYIPLTKLPTAHPF